MKTAGSLAACVLATLLIQARWPFIHFGAMSDLSAAAVSWGIIGLCYLAYRLAMFFAPSKPMLVSTCRCGWSGEDGGSHVLGASLEHDIVRRR